MKLLLYTDPLLRQPCKPVDLKDLQSIIALIPEMEKIMNEEGGIALAANQVGISSRFFIMRQPKFNPPVDLIVNPEIIEMDELQPFEEGCLSIPGVSAATKRAQRVKLRFVNITGDQVEMEFLGIEAVAIQHEIDHLDGKLYIDQLSPLKKNLTLERCRKYIKIRSRRLR